MNEAIAKAARDKELFAQRTDQLSHLTGPILRDLARNESAPIEWRKAAIELMLEKECVEVNHPDFASLLREVQQHEVAAQGKAKEEVQSVIESALEQPLDPIIPPARVVALPIDPRIKFKPVPPERGPFQASVTTKTMTKDEAIG
jgi:hypothetical protein